VNTTLVLVAIAAVTVLGFLIEAILYERLLRKIPIRIHVNGTRGKSSVARLIAGGLRGGGIRTCAKTTGTLARMIFSDGTEYPIYRPERANVIEQKRVVRAAVADGAEALVIECMALHPLLQAVCELKLVRATHGVITNARADHLDVMGPTRLDVAAALSATTPISGHLFTAEDRHDSLAVMRVACRDRGSKLHVIDALDAEDITAEELAGFSYLEHAENIALALAVCTSLGVKRADALRAMQAAEPDPGAMRVSSQTINRHSWHFVNAFAANDPESTERLWKNAYNQYGEHSIRICLMNCRVDRIDRSRTMADACSQWPKVDRFVVMGSGTDAFIRNLVAADIDSNKILTLGDAEGGEIITEIRDSIQSIRQSSPELANAPVMIMGIGNIYGPGMALVDYMASSQDWTQFDLPVEGEANKASQSKSTRSV
jgi:gamma-polyglutamate synthase